MVDVQEYERWRLSASEALRAAEIQAASGLHNWACFLAEQAAQLAFKGLLHGVGAMAWGHDLIQLLRRVEHELERSLSAEYEAAAQRLSRHYIPTRYPDAYAAGAPGAHYGPGDSAQAVADARLLLTILDNAWKDIGKA